MNRSIILAGWEASAMAALEAGSTMLLSRPIVGIPDDDDFDIGHYCPSVEDEYGILDAGPEIYGIYSRDGECGIPAPWQPGDVLLCREAWCLLPNNEVLYRVSVSAKDQELGHSLWLPASRMPLWAVRLRPTVVSVRAVRIADISNADILRLAIPIDEANGGVARVRLCDEWDRRWGKRYPWASNPWSWTLEVRR